MRGDERERHTEASGLPGEQQHAWACMKVVGDTGIAMLAPSAENLCDTAD